MAKIKDTITSKDNVNVASKTKKQVLNDTIDNKLPIKEIQPLKDTVDIKKPEKVIVDLTKENVYETPKETPKVKLNNVNDQHLQKNTVTDLGNVYNL